MRVRVRVRIVVVVLVMVVGHGIYPQDIRIDIRMDIQAPNQT